MTLLYPHIPTIKSHSTTIFLWFSYGFPLLYPRSHFIIWPLDPPRTIQPWPLASPGQALPHQGWNQLPLQTAPDFFEDLAELEMTMGLLWTMGPWARDDL